MHFGAQLQAAIEVLTEIEDRHRPAGDALRDWGKAHRFAGSGDRAIIGNLVFDALRRRRTLAARAGDDTPRRAVLAVAAHMWDRPLDQIDEVCAQKHGAGALNEEERAALSAPSVHEGTHDAPEWLEPSLRRAFGDGFDNQIAALSERAPVDLRVNLLKADRPKVLRTLGRFSAEETSLSPWGIRIPAPVAGKRYPNVEAESGHGKGWFEVQDEGSQVASLLAGAAAGAQVMDLCAGAGGKTLALAAAMDNKGQIHAYDSDRNRLRKIFDRLKRAGVRNVQVVEAGNTEGLAALAARMDVVFVDAPCTGSGTWRRRPDAKWRLSPEALERRRAEQAEVLQMAAPLVRPGGRLVYVTCSLLPEENADQVDAFLQGHPEFAPRPYRDAWPLDTPAPETYSTDDRTLLLTPQAHGTDGFYISVLERAVGD